MTEPAAEPVPAEARNGGALLEAPSFGALRAPVSVHNGDEPCAEPTVVPPTRIDDGTIHHFALIHPSRQRGAHSLGLVGAASSPPGAGDAAREPPDRRRAHLGHRFRNVARVRRRIPT